MSTYKHPLRVYTLSYSVPTTMFHSPTLFSLGNPSDVGHQVTISQLEKATDGYINTLEQIWGCEPGELAVWFKEYLDIHDTLDERKELFEVVIGLTDKCLGYVDMESMLGRLYRAMVEFDDEVLRPAAVWWTRRKVQEEKDEFEDNVIHVDQNADTNPEVQILGVRKESRTGQKEECNKIDARSEKLPTGTSASRADQFPELDQIKISGAPASSSTILPLPPITSFGRHRISEENITYNDKTQDKPRNARGSIDKLLPFLTKNSQNKELRPSLSTNRIYPRM